MDVKNSMKKIVASLFVVAAALLSLYNSAGAIEIPIQWCKPKPSLCQGFPQQNNPLYTADLPPNWGDAAQAYCKLVANGFAVYPFSTINNCACDGSVCSTLTSCDDQGIDPSHPQYEKVGVYGITILGTPPHAWT